MRLDISSQDVVMAVEVSLREIIVAQNLRQDADGALDLAAISAAAKRHETYLRSHVEVRADKEQLYGAIIRSTPPSAFTSADQSKYVYLMRYPLGTALAAENIVLRQSLLREFSQAPGHAWQVDYIIHSRDSDRKADMFSLGPDQEVSIPTGLKSEARRSGNSNAGIDAHRRVINTGDPQRWRFYLLAVALLLSLALLIHRRHRAPR